jgi:response regulator of citrate/malate metabolism
MEYDNLPEIKRTFENYTTTKLIQLFLEHPVYEYTRDELAGIVGESREDVWHSLSYLQKIGVVEVDQSNEEPRFKHKKGKVNQKLTELSKAIEEEVEAE